MLQPLEAKRLLEFAGGHDEQRIEACGDEGVLNDGLAAGEIRIEAKIENIGERTFHHRPRTKQQPRAPGTIRSQIVIIEAAVEIELAVKAVLIGAVRRLEREAAGP